MGNFNPKQAREVLSTPEVKDELDFNIDNIKGQEEKEKAVKKALTLLFKKSEIEIQDFTFSGQINMLFEVKLCFFTSKRKYFDITEENRLLLNKLIWKNLASTTCTEVQNVEKLTDEEILNVCVSSCQENMSLYLNVGSKSVGAITSDP